MKQEPSDELDTALRQWRIHEPLPPRFQERVWARIERAEMSSASSSIPVWEALKAWAEQFFARPAMAVAYVSALVVLGTAFGVKQAHSESVRVHHELSARYVQTLDPYLSAGL